MSRKTVLITGGAQGLGSAFASLYAENGFDVILADVLPVDSPQFTQSVRTAERHGVSVQARRCDVTSPAEVDALFTEAWERFQRLDVVIANAGVMALGETWNLTDAQVGRSLAVNLEGVWRTNSHAVRRMLRRGWGRIINVASIAGVIGAHYHAAYCMSKFGVIGLTKTLARELQGSGIRVNALCPSPVKSPMSETAEFITYMNRVTGKKFRNAREMYDDPATHFLEPETVARMAFWLGSSEEAGTFNGREIIMDLYGQV
ncbi:MAG: SDR family oxidoreductase [Desulfovibrio sp.]|jgi:NAD(P)-dependent dehydrogenase (short-subunit alcohol dehydrogenase family)|nr:SDR family oxidoreductase [Desulfovibrio sp.]